MNILFIIPCRGLGYPRIFKKRLFNLTSLTARTLLSLTPQEHNISIIDENTQNISLDSYKDIDADLIGINVHTHNAERAYSIATIFREAGKTVILGGIHVSSVPEEAIQYADSIVIGEAENVWKTLLDDFKKGSLKKIYKADELCTLNNPLPPARYHGQKAIFNATTVQTSRGCPHECEFCSVSAFYGHKWRYRPVDIVIEEIKQTGSRNIFFVDDNIFASKQYARDLFTGIKKLKVSWACQAEINVATDKALLELAYSSGCKGLMIGFDSVSHSSLNEAKKNHNRVENYIAAVRNIKKAGIPVVGSFIFGFDHDDESVFDKTLAMTKKMQIDLAYFFILTPYPGTELYRKLDDQKRILHKCWTFYDCNHVVFKPKKMSATQLEQGFKRAWNEFYSVKNVISRIIRNPKLVVILANTFYIFGRRLHKMQLVVPTEVSDNKEYINCVTQENGGKYGDGSRLNPRETLCSLD
jgi:radical SAM superfamily enzyme YgiQ (UPF0313 family)